MNQAAVVMEPSCWQSQLAQAAEAADRLTDWPDHSWQQLKLIGRLAASIPRVYGGTEASSVELLQSMEQIASHCLTTAFALSQREAAVRQLLKGPASLKERYLPRLASGQSILTVGLSQLTTSRQHLGPALRATALDNGGYQLDGEIPWVTAADQAEAVVAGATLSDAKQLLIVIPADRLVGMIQPPLALAALVGSRTSLIECRSVCVDLNDVLAGPTDSVLGKLGGGGLDTSCLAVGLSSAAIVFIRSEAAKRPDLNDIADKFEAALKQNRAKLHELSVRDHEPHETLALREDCTRLVLKSTQAALMIAKGNGFVTTHPVQRWARQALFFLVWSCPRPVAEGVLADLTNL